MTGRDRAWLAALALLFLAWRVPLMYRTVAGQDEDWYAVPGVAILRAGVPQIPYIPSRDPTTACYKADVILYVLPPLGFYLQAAAHLVLGPGIGPSRMASALEGLVAAWLLSDLARAWSGSRRAAFLAVLAYLISRPFLFPATTARPDMVTAACGLMAVRLAVRHAREPKVSSLVGAGIAAGLGLLAHPFGVVPASQVGLALLSEPGSLRVRVGRASLFAGVAALAFGLWLPLILLHPDIFRIQFVSHILLARAGPGLGATLLAPWSTLAYQARQFLDFVTPLQALALGLGTAWGLARGGGGFRFHLAASIGLLVLFEGRHPTLGYYAFPAAFACIGLGMLGDRIAVAIESRSIPKSAATGLVVASVAAILIPGAGIRPWLAQVRHWGDPDYDARAVARRVLDDIPAGATIAVDGGLVLDAYLAGRRVIDLTINPLAYDVRDQSFDYAVFTRAGLRLYKPDMDDLELVKTYGPAGDPFAAYAEVYRRIRP